MSRSDLSRVMSVRLTDFGSETRPARNRVWKKGPCVLTKDASGVYRRYYLAKRPKEEWYDERTYYDLCGAVGEGERVMGITCKGMKVLNWEAYVW